MPINDIANLNINTGISGGKETEAQLRRIEKAMGKTVETNKRLGRQTRSTTRDKQNFNRTGGKTSSIFTGLSARGTVLAGVIASIGAAFLLAGKQASTFNLQVEKAASEVNTLFDGTPATLREIRAIGRDLVREFGGDLPETIRALYDSASASNNGLASAQEEVAEAIKLATVNVGDNRTALNGLTTVLNVYGRELGATQRISDLFTLSTNQGKLTIGGLGSSINRLLPLTKALGIDLAEVFGTITVLSSAGFKEAEAITGLRGFFQAITDASDETRKRAQQFGIDFTAEALALEGGTEILIRSILNAQSQLGSTEFNNLLKTLIPSIEGRIAILALIGDVDKLTEFVRLSGVEAGITQRKYDAASESLERRYTVATGRASAINEEFGELINIVLVPAIELAVGAFEIFVGVLKFLRPALEAIGTILRGIAVVFNFVGGVINKVADFFNFGFKPAVEETGESLKTLQEIQDSVNKSATELANGGTKSATEASLKQSLAIREEIANRIALLQTEIKAAEIRQGLVETTNGLADAEGNISARDNIDNNRPGAIDDGSISARDRANHEQLVRQQEELIVLNVKNEESIKLAKEQLAEFVKTGNSGEGGGIGGVTEKLRDLNEGVRTIADSFDDLLVGAVRNFSSELVEAIDDGIDNFKDFSKVISSVANNLLKDIAKQVIENSLLTSFGLGGLGRTQDQTREQERQLGGTPFSRAITNSSSPSPFFVDKDGNPRNKGLGETKSNPIQVEEVNAVNNQRNADFDKLGNATDATDPSKPSFFENLVNPTGFTGITEGAGFLANAGAVLGAVGGLFSVISIGATIAEKFFTGSVRDVTDNFSVDPDNNVSGSTNTAITPSLFEQLLGIPTKNRQEDFTDGQRAGTQSAFQDLRDNVEGLAGDIGVTTNVTKTFNGSVDRTDKTAAEIQALYAEQGRLYTDSVAGTIENIELFRRGTETSTEALLRLRNSYVAVNKTLEDNLLEGFVAGNGFGAAVTDALLEALIPDSDFDDETSDADRRQARNRAFAEGTNIISSFLSPIEREARIRDELNNVFAMLPKSTELYADELEKTTSDLNDLIERQADGETGLEKEIGTLTKLQADYIDNADEFRDLRQLEEENNRKNSSQIDTMFNSELEEMLAQTISTKNSEKLTEEIRDIAKETLSGINNIAGSSSNMERTQTNVDLEAKRMAGLPRLEEVA